MKPNKVKFFVFDPKNENDKVAGSPCCICGRVVRPDGVVAETEGFHLGYCRPCVNGLKTAKPR